MKALIIEDEILASKHLQNVLEEVGGMTVIAVLESINETIAWFRSNPMPDIAFMDIHLADGLAFEVFKHVDVSCPIIFTTAYDEYALKAFKVNSIDYLLKPIEPEDVRDALRKLNGLTGKISMQKTIRSLIDTFDFSSKYRTHFLVPSKGDKLLPVQVSDLACFYIDSGRVKAMNSEGRNYVFDYTLDELEGLLNPYEFFRANRQYIISRAAIRDIDIWFGNRLSVNLKTDVPGRILISKARISEFKSWFGG